jgi:hypothetical protein
MTMWENQVEQEHHSKPVPEVLISVEGPFPEEQLTPPSIFPDIPSNLPPAGHREFLRKRRLLAKVLQQFQATWSFSFLASSSGWNISFNCSLNPVNSSWHRIKT